MSQKFIIFIFLIFIFQGVYSLDIDELFGDKSIIRKLRNELGSFIAETSFQNDKEHPIKESYNFKSKNGKVEHSIQSETVWAWLNDFEEFYYLGFQACSTLKGDDSTYLKNWSPGPSSTNKMSSKSKMLGPSHLLFLLIDHYDETKENVKCENIEDNKRIRCDLIFEKKEKIEYYFEDKGNQKMYPNQIKSFDQIENEFKLFKDINYTKFDYSFNGDDHQVDFEMPIGFGCNRKNENKYPIIGIDLGEQFKIEYDLELEYLDLDTKNKDKYLKIQFKSSKWFMDSNFSFSILDRIDEETKKNIRTYFDIETKLAYDIDGDKCIEYNLKDGYKQNWINTLFNIKLLTDFFFTGPKFRISYLRDYKLNDEIYRVFEEQQNNVPPFDSKDKYKSPQYNIVTHYYSKSDEKVPKLIEIRTRGAFGKLISNLKIKINKHNLASSSDNFNEKINLDQCFKNLNSASGYKKLNLIFKGNNLKSFNDNYIKYEFMKLIDRNSTRKNLLFSPLRIYNIELMKNNNRINITSNLLEPLNPLNYFKIIKDTTLDESKEKTDDGVARIIKSIDQEDYCAKLCLQNKDCAAYSFKRMNRICKLWIDNKFNGDIDNKYGYDWRKVKTKSEIDSIFGQRKIKFYQREHLPTINTLNLINELIKKKEFNLILKQNINDKGTKFSIFKKSYSNNSNLIKYLLYSFLAIFIISGFVFGIIKYRKKNVKNNSSKLELR